MKKNKEALISLIVFIAYLLLSTYSSNVLTFLGYKNLNTTLKIIISLFYNLFILLGVIFIYLKIIVKDFKDFKENLKYYVNNYCKYWILVIGLMLISNIIVSSISNITTPTNQEYIIKLLEKYPIYTLISTIIIAPILEELIFRLSFRKIFKNDLLFILLSGLVFGILHLSVAKTLSELLYIIPYSIPGFIFAYTLKKSNNILVPISLHMFHNTVLTIIQLILTAL